MGIRVPYILLRYQCELKRMSEPSRTCIVFVHLAPFESVNVQQKEITTEELDDLDHYSGEYGNSISHKSKT